MPTQHLVNKLVAGGATAPNGLPHGSQCGSQAGATLITQLTRVYLVSSGYCRDITCLMSNTRERSIVFAPYTLC